LSENTLVTCGLFIHFTIYASKRDVSPLGLADHLDILSISRTQCRIVAR